jgi:hypothetical protein
MYLSIARICKPKRIIRCEYRDYFVIYKTVTENNNGVKM